MGAVPKIKAYGPLYALFLLYSLNAVLGKLAAREPLISAKFLLLYGLSLLILLVYAVLWQRILRRISLVSAYANRGVVVLFGMLWGALLFGETIKWNMALGAAVIVFGLMLMARGDE